MPIITSGFAASAALQQQARQNNIRRKHKQLKFIKVLVNATSTLWENTLFRQGFSYLCRNVLSIAEQPGNKSHKVEPTAKD
jgi:hypothetical protein